MKLANKLVIRSLIVLMLLPLAYAPSHPAIICAGDTIACGGGCCGRTTHDCITLAKGVQSCVPKCPSDIRCGKTQSLCCPQGSSCDGTRCVTSSTSTLGCDRELALCIAEKDRLCRTYPTTCSKISNKCEKIKVTCGFSDAQICPSKFVCGKICFPGPCTSSGQPLAENGKCPSGFNAHAGKYCCTPQQFFDGNQGRCRDDLSSDVIDGTEPELLTAPEGTKIKLPDSQFCDFSQVPTVDICAKGKTYHNVCEARSSNQEIATKGPCCRTNADCQLITDNRCGCFAVKKGDSSPIAPNTNCFRFDCPKGAIAVCSQKRCTRTSDLAEGLKREILRIFQLWLDNFKLASDIFDFLKIS